jgi:uncharacterized membrane protein YbhN (UPF0104 family)
MNLNDESKTSTKIVRVLMMAIIVFPIAFFIGALLAGIVTSIAGINLYWLGWVFAGLIVIWVWNQKSK